MTGCLQRRTAGFQKKQKFLSHPEAEHPEIYTMLLREKAF